MKTRAFDPIEKRWRTDYVVMPNGTLWKTKSSPNVLWITYDPGVITEKVDWKLSRFTGWNDSCGNPIYQYHIVDANSKLRYLIDWNEERGTFVARRIYSKCEFADYPFVHSTANNCGIVGDIFTTPELLEEV